MRFMEEFTLAQFLWITRWNPGGPMIIGCPSIIGLPLISHLGSTLIFPARVIKQLSGLQDIPIEADRTSHRFKWANTTISLPYRILWVREVRRLWSTRIVQELYFPEHPTDEERAFSATAAYVMQFHPYGFAPIRRLRKPQMLQTPQADIPDAESSIQGAVRTELQVIRAERDRLRCELVDIRAELTDHRELQSELVQTRARIVLTTGVASISYSRMRKNGRRATTRHLGARRTTNAGTLPSARHARDVTSSIYSVFWCSPNAPPFSCTGAIQCCRSRAFRHTRRDDSEDMSFSAMTYVLTVSPVSDPMPPPPAPTSVPFPPAAFLSTDPAMLTLPPLTIPTQPPIYTVPPPTVPPVVITQISAPTAEPFSFQAPQTQMSFSYQTPPPLNILPTEPGTPTHAAPAVPPTNIPPENEQEKRMKRMEETIRALQASTSRPDFGDSDWNLFPGMLLPPKIKIPDFKIYDGTKDPRHHLRHYHSKMLSYWDYEEFVIQTFQDSLTGSALDWFMTLKAGDILTWTDLSQKFLDQYRFCAETPPTLLDLSMSEMRESQTFEAYATKWRGKAAKHIPPITERQQVQLFHSTLRGAYYSHFLAHTSSFSDLIEARKKLNMGVKLGRIEDPSRKKDGETLKKQTAGISRRGKDATIGIVNSGHQAP
ncbi:hypothetical protein CRG98_028629 [Punica granatum]|uniref:Retrotransposon gag domain-containing protein n=1 Tax=Punica granatum TaxID=22663 RepID=A0A2I0J423_PUNGR|nr:hypothetical protein CRG98_028629 [Punica granatum]